MGVAKECWCPPPDLVITSFRHSARKSSTISAHRFSSFVSPGLQKSIGTPHTHTHTPHPVCLSTPCTLEGVCQFPYGVRQQILPIAQLAWDRQAKHFLSSAREVDELVNWCISEQTVEKKKWCQNFYCLFSLIRMWGCNVCFIEQILNLCAYVFILCLFILHFMFHSMYSLPLLELSNGYGDNWGLTKCWMHKNRVSHLSPLIGGQTAEDNRNIFDQSRQKHEKISTVPVHVDEQSVRAFINCVV